MHAMPPRDYLLTFELSKDGDELAIHLDQHGLDVLLAALNRLHNRGSSSPNDMHLMSNMWGGDKLSGEAQSPDSTLLHKVDLRLWKK